MLKTIYFAGGCFWGTQKFFDQFDGVLSTTVGYANGRTDHPTYEQLYRTGHAETVKVDYDPWRITLPELLISFLYASTPGWSKGSTPERRAETPHWISK